MELYYNDIFLQHDTGNHPENRKRLEYITNKLYKSSIWQKINHIDLSYNDSLKVLADNHATLIKKNTRVINSSDKINPTDEIDFVESAILKNHTAGHIYNVKSGCEKGGMLDGDTVVVPASYNAAKLAVSYSIAAVQNTVLKNTASVVLPRPPGHHAEKTHSMGFCLFNNIAIAAKYLKSVGYKKILIFDFDVHHGNGTQNSFYDDNEVFFISTHQFPFYPGSGAEHEKGIGKGEGYTLNLPIPAYSDINVYIKKISGIKNKIEDFAPEIILISAGFDAHKDDPLAQMELSSGSFAIITELLLNLTDNTHGRVVSFLEGGYNLNALAESVHEHISVIIQ